MTGTIPHSDALAEVAPESLQDLFSRDPEHYQAQDIPTIVRHMREFQERLAAAGAAHVRQVRVQKPALPTPSVNPEDLGL